MPRWAAATLVAGAIIGVEIFFAALNALMGSINDPVQDTDKDERDHDDFLHIHEDTDETQEGAN